MSLCVWVPWELMSGVEVPGTRALPAGTGRLGLRLERGSPLQTEVCLLSILPLFSSFPSPFGTWFAWSRVTGLCCRRPCPASHP